MTSSFDSFLVDTDWLEEHLQDPDLRIFDVTGCNDKNYVNQGRERHYDLHHISGAAYLDVASPKGEMSNPDAELPFTWPTQAQFEATMSRLGVDNQSKVVLYSGPNPEVPGSGSTWATRAWWLMHHFGVDCAILDGGWNKWQRENRKISSEEHLYPATEFHAMDGWRKGLADQEDVLQAITIKSGCVIDSLSRESFHGEVDANYGTFGKRKGHITGAVNVNYESLLDPETGCYHKAPKLRMLFEDAWVDLRKPIITYCGGGIGATSTGFALKLLGYDNVAIYDASLMEWANDETLPMTDLTIDS